MKKYYMMFAAVAAMATISCNKDLGQNDSIKESHKGTPIQVVVGNPESCVDTKVSSFREMEGTLTTNPKWDAGDAFQMFSHDATNQLMTDWDKFVTADGSTSQYNSNATFAGYIPEGYTTDSGGSSFTAIVTNEYNPSYALTYDSKPRYTFNCNIPSEQDGTGLKYSLFGSKQATYNGVEKSLSGFAFRCWSSLCALNLPAGSNIVKIEITMSYENEDYASSQFLASKGERQDLKWQVSDFTFVSGGGSKTITIYNNGTILPEGDTPVYFACARTLSGKALSGNQLGACILTFKFTNNDGLVATKIVTLYKNGTYYNIQNGNNLNNFGAVTFAEGDFQTVS